MKRASRAQLIATISKLATLVAICNARSCRASGKALRDARYMDAWRILGEEEAYRLSRTQKRTA